MKKNNKNKKSLFLKLVLIFGVFILCYISYRLYHEIYRQNEIDQEIQALQDEINKLEQDNNNLQDLISYFQTDEFKEKEAKDKLNLVKKGEKVILIKEREVKRDKEVEEEKPEILVNRPNYYYWWHYFFSID
jgi:cell division protein DivIC